MQPIQINVQVNVGLNDNVVTLLSSLLNRGTAPAPAEAAAPKPKKQPTAKPQAAVEKPADKPEEASAVVENPQPEAQPAQAETNAPAEAAPVKAKEYTVVDVRAAMDRTRKRIEGEDYKENTESELYKKWHRRLTGWFKNTSAILGAEKPSALTGSDNIAKFVESCDALQVEGDDFKEDCPF